MFLWVIYKRVSHSGPYGKSLSVSMGALKLPAFFFHEFFESETLYAEVLANVPHWLPEKYSSKVPTFLGFVLRYSASCVSSILF
jgi:hypothetical protein